MKMRKDQEKKENLYTFFTQIIIIDTKKQKKQNPEMYRKRERNFVLFLHFV